MPGSYQARRYCVIRIARAEMGQGTLTGLAQLVAEELECNWKKVTTEQITPGAEPRAQARLGRNGDRRQPRHPQLARLCSSRRRGGAHDADAGGGDAMESAGRRSSRSPNGVITHAASKRTTSYGKVAAAAAKLTPPDPKTIKLKDPKKWKIAGKPLKRLDTADKLNGSKVYAIDVKLPGMLCAAIKQCPVFGGKLESFDEAKIASEPGVPPRGRRSTTRRSRSSPIHGGSAKTALDALPIVWDEGAGATQSSATIAEHLKDGLTAPRRNGERRNGDALKAIDGAAKKVEAVYATPFLAHATMEPMNCTARIGADKAEVWVPTQNAEARSPRCRRQSGLPLDKCEVYKLDLGGGFGRRGGTQDYVRQAVAIAKQFPGVPVKLIWSREEDMAHDFYRPISQCKLASPASTPSGNLVGAAHARVGPVDQRFTRTRPRIEDGRDDAPAAGLLRESPATRSSATRCRTC